MTKSNLQQGSINYLALMGSIAIVSFLYISSLYLQKSVKSNLKLIASSNSNMLIMHSSPNSSILQSPQFSPNYQNNLQISPNPSSNLHIVNQKLPTPPTAKQIFPSTQPSTKSPSLIISNSNSGCIIAGCSGQLCVDTNLKSIETTCEYKPEYACLKYAICEMQNNGYCGWTYTPEYYTCSGNQ